MLCVRTWSSLPSFQEFSWLPAKLSSRKSCCEELQEASADVPFHHLCLGLACKTSCKLQSIWHFRCFYTFLILSGGRQEQRHQLKNSAQKKKKSEPPLRLVLAFCNNFNQQADPETSKVILWKGKVYFWTWKLVLPHDFTGESSKLCLLLLLRLFLRFSGWLVGWLGWFFFVLFCF